MKPYKAEIEWIDHASTQGWCTIGKDNIGLVKMHSFCWVVSENKSEVVISSTVDDQGHVKDPLAIGRKLITKLKKQK